jgi:hypothetical protein
MKAIPIEIKSNRLELGEPRLSRFASCAARDIRKFYDNPENEKAFEEWLHKRQEEEREHEKESQPDIQD